MASLNKVILIGRLGKDPEVTTYDNGNKRMSVTIATSERYRDRDGNWVEQTDWHNVVAWGNLALDIAEKRRNYIKGDMLYVEGRLKTRQYTDNQNMTRYITEIVADKMMSIASNRANLNNPQPNASYNSYQQQTVVNQANNDSYQHLEMPNPNYDGDDLPF